MYSRVASCFSILSKHSTRLRALLQLLLYAHVHKATIPQWRWGNLWFVYEGPPLAMAGGSREEAASPSFSFWEEREA